MRLTQVLYGILGPSSIWSAGRFLVVDLTNPTCFWVPQTKLQHFCQHCWSAAVFEAGPGQQDDWVRATARAVHCALFNAVTCVEGVKARCL